MFDEVIAYHCSPALAGIKPSNLVAIYKNKFPNAKAEIQRLNQSLNQKDIYLHILCECDYRLLLIVYRKEKLLNQLQQPQIASFLKKYGYDKCNQLTPYFEVLQKHLQGEDFPHEIGAFLGYPLHDIYGFIRAKGQGCLYVGAWKVYDDLETAKKTFCRYKICRNAVLQRVNSGKTLAQIFYAA